MSLPLLLAAPGLDEATGQSASVQSWTRQLSDEDPRVRWYAAYELGQAGAAAAQSADAIVRTLKKLAEDEYVRGGAAWALGRLGKADVAVPALLSVLNSPLDSVRRNAAVGLGELGPAARPAIAPLVAALKDRDATVRIQAALALWHIDRHAQAIPTLAEMLRDGSDSAPYEAAMALGELGKDALPALPDLMTALRKADADTVRAAGWAIGRIGSPAIAPVRKLLADSDESVRFRAVEALARIGPEATSALVEALKDPTPAARRAAARALGRIGPTAREATPALLAAANDPDTAVRQEAAAALKSLRQP